MKERPIIMQGESVRAIWGGRKTQTRRVIKPQPGANLGYMMGYSKQYAIQCGEDYPDDASDRVKCPYGVPGDRLWVRETCCLESCRTVGYYPPPFNDGRPIQHHDDEAWGAWWEQPHYKATDPTPELDVGREDPGVHWRPSMFMPRWSSRITLEVTAVRVEWVQDISEADAAAEGAEYHDGHGVGHSGWRHDPYGPVYGTARASYAALWDSINAKRGFGWDVNPWVWVVEFRRVA